MMYIDYIYPHQTQAMKQLTAFLEAQNLAFEPIDVAIVLKEKDKIIGSCCRLGNVIKMVAIDPKHQSMNLLDQLMSAMQVHLFDAGYTNSFIYSPTHNRDIFRVYHYQEIMQVQQVSLLEQGQPVIHEVINDLIKRYNPHLIESGALVINGNPFTLGHQYLIETAAAQVQQLLVFVVEEDVSFFDFKTRMDLIEAGTSHLDNVVVLPSSQYIISQTTFPNYFLRNLDDHFKLFALFDAHLFGRYFSQLNITKRFVGEEPLDLMTHAYNQTLLAVLPEYKMQVEVVPRKHNELGVISASKVRELLKRGDYETLKSYVPQTTFDFLKNNPNYEQKAKDYERAH
ncbi:MAG: [citrate (pro-3S)-lyase] ligase [Erysipelothrix sp.]|nr:[citrate (pro-3S)-lyase] ligase [Erysipelothrix sp.]